MYSTWQGVATMELYREGFLNKAGKGIIQTRLHSWRPRYFIFDGKDLTYYKSKEIIAENLLGTIHMIEVESVGLMKNDKKSFHITTKSPKSRTYYMSGQSEEEAMAWVRVLEMGKARQAFATETGSLPDASKKTMSVYSGVTLPKQSILDPSSPKTAVPSEYSMLGPVSPPSSPTIPARTSTSSATTSAEPSSPTKPIHSEYECIGNVIQNLPGQTEAAAQNIEPPTDHQALPDDDYDPTYEQVPMVNVKDSLEAPLKESYTEIKCDTPPPDVPKQDPSLTIDEAGYQSIEECNKTTESDQQMKGIGGGDFPTMTANVAPTEIYDDVKLESKEGEAKDNNANPNTQANMPVYAKPNKRKSSKRTMPGMMDIGEVSQEVEEETAGGKDTLKHGMTSPIGETFAVEELKELLHKYEKEGSLHDGSKPELADFHFNEDESAFDVLKRFLHQQ